MEEQQHSSLEQFYEGLPKNIVVEYDEYLRKLNGKKYQNVVVRSKERFHSGLSTKGLKKLPHVKKGSSSVSSLVSEGLPDKGKRNTQSRNLRYQRRCSRKSSKLLTTAESLPVADAVGQIKNEDQTMDDDDKEEESKADGRPFKCVMCEVKFKTKENRNAHSVKIHGIKRYKCLICDEKFLHKTEMLGHLRTHAGHDGFECPVCLKLYKTVSSFLPHMNKVHLKDLKLPCPECGLIFKSKWLLRSHSLVHTKQQKFVCPLCNKRCSVKTVFLDHINVHSELKPYQCEHCDKKFGSQSLLRDHTKRHNNCSKFSCSLCDKKFVSGSLLKKHSRVHETKKLFECKECGKKFKLPQTLVSHKMVHIHKNQLPKSREKPLLSISTENLKRTIDNQNDSEDEDNDDHAFLSSCIPLDSVEINKDPLDLNKSIFDNVNAGTESEEECVCE